MADDGGHEEGADDARPAGTGWLTYRYRLGGGAVNASGTLKAPSFAEAARTLVGQRLAQHVGAGPAYLRLRVAGQDEVVFRIMLGATPARGPHLAVVPPDTYAFGPPGDADAARDPTP